MTLGASPGADSGLLRFRVDFGVILASTDKSEISFHDPRPNPGTSVLRLTIVDCAM